MDQDSLKQIVAEAALDFVEDDAIIGVGTGSTVNCFIECLAKVKHKIEGAVASSLETEKRLRALSIPVIDLNNAPELSLYVDGADEVNALKQMIKGGGGALTREKIVAAVADKFICIVDESKKVDWLSQKSPVPLEVIPMARSYVGRQCVKLGGTPEYREGFTTDNGGVILDVYNLKLQEPIAWEEKFDAITGVVCSGVFAKRRADVVLMAKADGTVGQW